ncbi:MAG TPA: PDZ domain-containing protein [Fimbriimonadales bacterium]|nr:PDZ domain-containing protein [Fimbriimonadales bacterium]
MITNLLLTLSLLQTPAQVTAPLEAPFHIAEDAIIVDAVINGKTISFMFDTGFGGQFIINDQINIGPYTGTVSLQDFVGVFQAHKVDVKGFQIGQLKQSKTVAEAIMQPVAHMSQSYGAHTDGIMGLGAVIDYVTEINFEHSKFIFHPKSLDITKRKPDNKRTFLIKMEPRGMNAVVLPTEINGQPLHLALDTGNAFYATTHKEVLERAKLWDSEKKPLFVKQSMVASGPVDSFSMLIPNATIFGVPVKDSAWDIIDLPAASVQSDGTVGFGFLKNFNIILDYERRYVWLENFTGKVKDDLKGEPGFALYRKEGGGYVIFMVYKGSPAAEKGIKEDDTLLAVDGTSLSSVTPSKVRELLQGAPDSICKLVISRGGIIQHIDVPRKLMVNYPAN